MMTTSSPVASSSSLSSSVSDPTSSSGLLAYSTRRKTGALLSLRDVQKHALTNMLHFNNSSRGRGNALANSNIFKVFVYDEFCRDIVTPTLTVNDLRDAGVTLHMMLHSKRERISDVPAVYFVQPNALNVQRIAEDCENDLYGAYYLNFVSSIPRPLLESLAQRTLAKHRAQRVAKIVDQQIQFLCLERDMFTLNLSETFKSYFDPRAKESSINGKMEQIARGLFSAMVTMKHVPVIQCPKGGAAEAVARRLDKLIRFELGSAESLFQDSEQLPSGQTTVVDGSVFGAQRPLLLLIERSTDLVAIMRHSIVYQDLVHDLLGNAKLNRVTFFNAAKNTKETCALDPERDPFWREHAGDEFHVAVKVNNSELQKLNATVDRLQRLAASQATGGGEAANGSPQSASLASAIEKLPELLKRKKQLTQHTSILEAIMDQIDRRSIHEFYKAEDAVLANPTTAPEGLRALMTKGTVSDRLRLLCICSAVGALDEIGLDENLRILKMAVREAESAGASGGDGGATKRAVGDSAATDAKIRIAEGVVKFLQQQQKEKAMLSAKKDASEGGGGDAALSDVASSSHASNVLRDLWSKGVAELSQRLGSGSTHSTTVAERVLNACCTPTSARRSAAESQMRRNIRCFDPRTDPSDARSPRRHQRATFRSAVVFVIGGGHTSELHALRRWERSGGASSMRAVVYGCTELINADSLLEQIASVM